MKKIMRLILLICGIGAILYSTTELWGIYSEYSAGEQLYAGYAEKFTTDMEGVIKEVQEQPVNLPETEVATVTEKAPASRLVIDFNALFKENSHVVGWIQTEGTAMNYPIVQAADNDYYLYRMFNGVRNSAGSIYLDYRNSASFTDLNTIIYGHNMNNGTMFGTLKHYRSQSYYNQHPNIRIYTPSGNYTIAVVAGFKTDTSSGVYRIPKTTKQLAKLHEEVINQSTFRAQTALQAGDRLVTLSTCADSGGDTTRYVVVGKIIRN